MMNVNRLDLIHQYYVDEWPIDRIAKESGCTPPTVRSRRVTFGMLDRDREWTEEDDQRAHVVMAKVTMGASLIGDMRTMASELMHRTSVILSHCSQEWLMRYAPHVDVIPSGIGGHRIDKPTMRIRKLVETATTPRQQTAGSAGYDLYSTEDVAIDAHTQKMIGTGLAISVPTGWVGLICVRSGMAVKGMTVQNSPGVLDSDYTGEVKVILYNTGTCGDDAYKVNVGDRIAQLLLVPCFWGDVVEVSNLESTERGSGGFGHTGQ